MFSIFKKKSNTITDINWLGVDMHNHLLPGIDDGCKTVEESIRYIKRLENLGFEKLICTPHIFKELYPNNLSTIKRSVEGLRRELNEQRIETRVEWAAEYMVDEFFEVNSILLCLPGNYLLVEMSYLNETPNIEQIIFDLLIAGYHVILAHPERYNFYHQVFERYQRLKDMGCFFQLNLLSVMGYYGKDVQRIANRLLEKKLYDFAGTDLHHEKHLLALEKGALSGKLYHSIGKYEFKNKAYFA